MMGELKYLLDANIFIEAARRYYSFDFGTKFWDFLLEKAKKNVLCSIDKVYEEIKKGDEKDSLRQWSENYFKDYFYTTKYDEVLVYYKEIINYVNSQSNKYTTNAIDEFLEEDNADPWIIAYAKCKDLIVVTHETFNPSKKNKVLIPNVCKYFKIEFTNTFEMLKDLGFKL